MHKKNIFKALIENLTNSHIYYNFLPSGVDIFYDFNKSLKGFDIRIIFDVGANIGQSAEKFRIAYPKSEIFCFEPVSSTFNILEKQFSSIPGVNCFKVALGALESTSYMVIDGLTNDCSHIVDDMPIEKNNELVSIKTLDNFCYENNINHIDFLKIDTEGKDLDVLKGAEKLLSNMSIGAIQVEASMNNKNTFHIPLESFKSFFESKGYFLFKIYDQVQENDSPIQRRANPVFISSKILLKN